MELFKIFGSIIINDTDAIKSLQKSQQEAYKTDSSLNRIQDTGKKFDKMGKNLTKKLTLPIAGLGAIAFKVAADVEDSVGAVDQVFGKSSKVIKDWTRTLPAYYGISRGEALEHASVMGSMLKNIGGLTEEVAAQQSQALIELAGDLSAMYGGSVEDSMNAITSALSGNNQAMKKYGTAILDADVKQKAFELGLYSGTGAMSAQAKQAGTLAIIMDQTADALGQAGRESDGASGSMKEFTTSIQNLTADLGEVLLPMITPVIQKLSEWIQKFNELDDGTKRNIVIIAGIVAAIGPLLIIIGKVISIFGSLATIASVLGISIGALVAPVLAVIAVIGSIIAIGVSLYKNWDTIKLKASELWQSVKVTFNNIKDAIMTPINKAKDAVWSAIEKIKGFFNFQWSFPKLKMPHFSVQGSANPLKWLSEGVPKLKVDWYKKGGIMTRPTPFGINGDSIMAGGEADKEAILPLNRKNLSEIGKGISQTMNNSDGIDYQRLSETIVNTFGILLDGLGINVDGRQFAKLVLETSKRGY